MDLSIWLPVLEEVEMLLLDEIRIERVIGSRRSLILIGLSLMIAPFVLPKGWSFGALSGFALICLGVYAARLRNWRFEPGLWMLAIFLALAYGALWALFEWPVISGLFATPDPNVAKPFRWSEARYQIDGAIALVLFARLVRFTASVAVGNWQRTHSVGTYEAESDHVLRGLHARSG